MELLSNLPSFHPMIQQFLLLLYVHILSRRLICLRLYRSQPLHTTATPYHIACLPPKCLRQSCWMFLLSLTFLHLFPLLSSLQGPDRGMDAWLKAQEELLVV